uniref:Uncharacterized protein n=1 Tax=uncultured organism MedDCM-OCT-S08-C1656 TaxID=743631 RepID=D6PKP5_9ZZZZ|nr:hypothetical protein [uncultured organism MedDCM-OCT-S08-C1656]
MLLWDTEKKGDPKNFLLSWLQGKKLRRVAIGGLGIKNVSSGQTRLLKKEEIELLFPREVS